MYKFLAGLIVGLVGAVVIIWAFDIELVAPQGNTEAPTGEQQQVVQEQPLPVDSIVGVWRSVDDAKFMRTIYENGGYMDTYEGEPEATINGPWVTFAKETAPTDFPYELADGTKYLQLDAGGDALYFTIATSTESELSLIFLNRGGVLNFTRVAQ